PELSLSFDEWQRSKIFAVQVQQIKRHEDARRLSRQKILKDWPAFSVDAGNLAIEYSVLDLQVFRDPGGKFSKAMKRVPIAGDQLAFSVVHVSQRAESVDLQLVEIFVRVEGFGTAGEPDGAEVWHHSVDY